MTLFSSVTPLTALQMLRCGFSSLEPTSEMEVP